MRNMIAVLGYETSRSFWRLVYPTSRTPGMPDVAAPRSSYLCNARDFKALWPSWLTQEILDLDDGRVHLLAFDWKNRRESPSHVAHVWSGPVPDGSFYDLGTGLYVCSPQFLFLQTAATHSLAQTIAYGDELCGTYSFDPFSERGMRSRKRLMSLAALRSYTNAAHGCPGHRQACRALQYMVENSASPAETKDEMLICLPFRYGGYNVLVPELNPEFPLSPAAARFVHKSVLYPDLFWENANLAIEHYGWYDHSGETKSTSDRARVNALKEMGLEVIELTADQVGDLVVFETIVLRIAALVGKLIDPSKLGPLPQRIALRHELSEWNANGGRKSR